MDGSLFVRVNMGFLDRRLSSRARARVDTRARGDDRRAAVKRERATGIPVVSLARAAFDEASKRVDERGDGARARRVTVAIARGVTSKMSSGSGTTAPGTPHAGEEASALETALETSGA